MYQTTDKDLWGWDYAKLYIYLNWGMLHTRSTDLKGTV